MDQIVPELRGVVERLVAALSPERIYLFGSQVLGMSGADSDYDLLIVVGGSSEPPYRRAQAAYRLLHGAGVPLDIVVLTRQEFENQLPVEASLPATVIREGHLLYAA